MREEFPTVSNNVRPTPVREQRQRLALTAVLVVRWSKDLNIIFIMFELSCTSCELMEKIRIFYAKKGVFVAWKCACLCRIYVCFSKIN
jgi:hypothetical protein